MILETVKIRFSGAHALELHECLGLYGRHVRSIASIRQPRANLEKQMRRCSILKLKKGQFVKIPGSQFFIFLYSDAYTMQNCMKVLRDKHIKSGLIFDQTIERIDDGLRDYRRRIWSEKGIEPQI